MRTRKTWREGQANPHFDIKRMQILNLGWLTESAPQSPPARENACWEPEHWSNYFLSLFDMIVCILLEPFLGTFSTKLGMQC